jgi:hypothetical protein
VGSGWFEATARSLSVLALSLLAHLLELRRNYLDTRRGFDIPGITSTVHGRKWNTSMENLEIRLILLIEITGSTSWYRCREADNFVMSNDFSGLDDWCCNCSRKSTKPNGKTNEGKWTHVGCRMIFFAYLVFV